MSVQAGQTYRHYKGPFYKTVSFALHSETEEELVIYYAIEKPEQLWARPRTMFESDVEIDGKTVKRFTLVK
jgi:hypothetical protein